MGYAALTFDKAYPCGDCASQARVDELNNFCNSLEAGSALREEADAEMGRELLKLSRTYPISEKRKKFKPLEHCGKPAKELRGSGLTNEVLWDDLEVEEVDNDWAAYYEEWGQWWTTTADSGEEPPAWQSVGRAEASSVAQELETQNAAYEQDVENPWVEVSDELYADLVPTSCSDTQTSAKTPLTALVTAEGNTQLTSVIGNQIQNMKPCTNTFKPSKVPQLSQQQPDCISAKTTETATLGKSSNTSSAPTITACASFSHDQAKGIENHKFKTLPPHLRRQVVSFNSRRASTSDCNESELLDALEQFKCFQLQTVIAVRI